jgi:Tol biopolymer transport system component/imidazolonepropionase-like amidohydrolase
MAGSNETGVATFLFASYSRDQVFRPCRTTLCHPSFRRGQRGFRYLPAVSDPPALKQNVRGHWGMPASPFAFVSATLLVLSGCIRSEEPTAHTTDAIDTITIRAQEGTTLGFDLSPDGGRITMDLLGQLWELPSSGGEARRLTDAVRDTAEDLDPSYSPDGRRIVFRGERNGRTGLWLLDRDADSPVQLTQLQNPDGYDGDAAWSPDGQSIAFAHALPADSAVTRWHFRLNVLDLSRRTVRELRVDETREFDLRDPTWEPGGTRLAVVASPPGERSGQIWIVEAGGGRAIPATTTETRAVAPVFSPDGLRLAFFAPDATERVQVWVLRIDGHNAAPVRVTDHADVTRTRIRWTPDGKQLVYGADGRLWRVSLDGGPPTEILFEAMLTFARMRPALPPARFPDPGVTQSVRAFMGLAISPDGRDVAMLALGKLSVMPNGGQPRTVTEVPLSAHHVAWSANGAALAWSAGAYGAEDLFETDVATGSTRQVTALPGREEYPTYAPDGQHLAFLHSPSEGVTILRVVATGTDDWSDTTRMRSYDIESGADVFWNPDGDGLLCVTGGFRFNQPTKGEIIHLSGARSAVPQLPDSPLFLQWTTNSIVFVRHARLWRAPFDSTGVRAAAEPLGAEPAMYASAARDGTILYVSEGGLRMRAPNGREQRLGWPISYTPPVAPPMLIRNARIIDGTGAPATPPQDLFIERGRIIKIGGPGTLENTNARVIDAGNRYMIPGLFDLHAHTYRPDLLPGFVYFGVTTIRDQGSPIGPLIAHADAIAAGVIPGPRIGYGGLQFYSDWAYDTEDGQGVEPEADPEHASRAVALAHALGSQHIKTRTFRRWDIDARLITEAHRRGMRVTGHCAHPLPLIAAGIDSKEHAGFCSPRGDGLIYDDLVQLYRAARVSVVPTIAYGSFAAHINANPDLLDQDPELYPFVTPRDNFAWMMQLDASGRRQFMQFAEWARAATSKLARGGVTIGVGTDIWQIPTGVHMEMEELVAAGLSPLAAIHAATGGASAILGAEEQFGTVTVGKWADLVILDADPTTDIRNTRKIWAVVQSGRLVDRSAINEGFRHLSGRQSHE